MPENDLFHRTWKEVQADAACVDLKGRCPHFYELGCKIAPVYVFCSTSCIVLWHIQELCLNVIFFFFISLFNTLGNLWFVIYVNDVKGFTGSVTEVLEPFSCILLRVDIRKH